MIWVCLCVCGVNVGLRAADAGVPEVWLDRAAATRWLTEHGGRKSFFLKGVIPGSEAHAFIALSPPGRVVIHEVREGSVAVEGAYEIGDAGEITLRMEGKGPMWPVLHLYQRGSFVGLTQRDAKTAEMGDVTRCFGGKPLWSFKRMKTEGASR